MPTVTSNAGELAALTALLATNLVLHLYSNDVILDESGSNVVGDFTEVTAAGYSAKTLTGGSWTIETVSNVGTATYAEQVFTITAAMTARGYYITNVAGTVQYWAEKFTDGAGADAPCILGADGGTCNVTPKYTANHKEIA